MHPPLLPPLLPLLLPLLHGAYVVHSMPTFGLVPVARMLWRTTGK